MLLGTALDSGIILSLISYCVTFYSVIRILQFESASELKKIMSRAGNAGMIDLQFYA